MKRPPKNSRGRVITGTSMVARNNGSATSLTSATKSTGPSFVVPTITPNAMPPLITTSRHRGDPGSPLGGQVHGFLFPPGRPRDRHQALRLQALERRAEVALVVPQGLHQIMMAGRHGAP